MKSRYLAGLAAMVAVFIADQVSKAAALALIRDPVPVTPFFNLVMVWNHGISFGLFRQSHDMGPYILASLSFVISLFFAVWLFRARTLPLALALGAVIGGALGNAVDRLRHGAVVDFLDFHAFGWHWPAFNFADSFIVLGIAFVVIDGLFFDPDRKPKAPTHETL